MRYSRFYPKYCSKSHWGCFSIYFPIDIICSWSPISIVINSTKTHNIIKLHEIKVISVPKKLREFRFGSSSVLNVGERISFTLQCKAPFFHEIRNKIRKLRFNQDTYFPSTSPIIAATMPSSIPKRCCHQLLTYQKCGGRRKHWNQRKKLVWHRQTSWTNRLDLFQQKMSQFDSIPQITIFKKQQESLKKWEQQTADITQPILPTLPRFL